MKHNQITQSGNIYYPATQGINHPELPLGVYTLHWSPKKDFIFLEKIQETFKLPSKIYYQPVDTVLKSVILKSWSTESESNLGVLLTGEKGQGKTLLAKDICNIVKLPVIIIGKEIPLDIDFVQFISSIKQDVVVFVDEFEKLFDSDYYNENNNGKHNQKSFLSFMDGVYTEHKRLFILTTNSKVSEFLLNRPSRIKFLRNYYRGIDVDMFNKIIDDNLSDPILKDDLKNNLDPGSCTIDVLMQIIHEVNVQEIPYSAFAQVFNYTPPKKEYIVELVVQDKVVSKITLPLALDASNLAVGNNIGLRIKFTEDAPIEAFSFEVNSVDYYGGNYELSPSNDYHGTKLAKAYKDKFFADVDVNADDFDGTAISVRISEPNSLKTAVWTTTKEKVVI